MSKSENLDKIDLILPTTGKLFFERKFELQFCKPHLMPLKSITLEKVERMQRDTHQLLNENRVKTATENLKEQ